MFFLSLNNATLTWCKLQLTYFMKTWYIQIKNLKIYMSRWVTDHLVHVKVLKCHNANNSLMIPKNRHSFHYAILDF